MSVAKEGFTVVNNAGLLEVLNGFLPAVQGKVVMDALKTGAASINEQAKASLYASKKGTSKTNYSYYSRAFKMEDLKSKTPLELGVRTGVRDAKNGYKLRWIEFGTNTRFTSKKKGGSGGANRGKITGVNFFFNAVRGHGEKIFGVVSDAVIASLDNLTKS